MSDLSYGVFINGSERPASNGATFEVVNPANKQVVCEVADGTADDVVAAVAVATEAFDDGRWSRQRGRDRARVLYKAAALLAERTDELARFETLQIGRPLREMQAQLARAPEWLEYMAGVAQSAEGSVPDFGGHHLNYVLRVPIGVAGLITPWNHPLLILIKKLSAAVAAGNSVVVKPSEFGPIAAIELAKICEEAGVPAGVINVVPGLGATTGKALAEHRGLARLDITGGTETGRHVAAAAGRTLTPISAELGGKAPVVVFDDVKPGVAAAGAAFASFVATGQTCIQGSRLVVQRGIYDEVVDLFVKRATSLRTGDPLETTTQLGPLASAQQFARVSTAVDRARAEGANILCGGHPYTEAPLDRGYYYAPTVIADPDRTTSAWREEIFGPVTVVTAFDTEADAIEMANDTCFGLAASVWTHDVARAHRVVHALDVGIAWINDHHRIDPASPWGGVKDSGIGWENGLDSYRSYTRNKSVIVNMSDEPFDWYASEGPMRYS